MNTRALGVIVPIALVAAACTGQAQLPELRLATDSDPSPDVIHVALDARIAKTKYGESPETEVWTYDGTVPGPLIDAAVGQKLIVDLRNDLPEGTTIHWHGVRVPNAMDGVALMNDPVPSGGTFRYQFILKDAGLFWFHPHVDTALQVRRGLYGVIRVRGSAEPPADDERILVLDDVKLRPDGTLFEYLDDTSAMIGRQGNTLLANGAVHPVVDLPAGGVTRLRIVNVANARYFNLAAPPLQFVVYGSDGSPYASPYTADSVLLVPGERVDLFLKGPQTGDVELMTMPYERGHETGSDPALKVATLRFRGKPTATPLPSAPVALERLAPPLGPPAFGITLDEREQDAGVAFLVNGAQWPDVAPWNAAPGVNGFEIQNDSPMDHPFHLHGFFFQVLSREDVPEPSDRLVWKDTLNVPAMSKLRAAVRFDEPGQWVYHCHILEHAEAGMMGEVNVP